MQKYRKNQSQSTTQILKSKYLDGKNNSVNKQSSKIMLTDLCAQQKVKIGQLIKTLEQRKRQNQQLNQQLFAWKSNYNTLQKMKAQLLNLLNVKNEQINKININLQKITSQNVQKDIQLQQLHKQLENLKQKIKKNTNVWVSTGVSTQKIQTATVDIQTKDKRRKQKSIQVQVNIYDQFGIQNKQTRKNHFYQPNSKSFDKIINGQKLSDQKFETAIFCEETNQKSSTNARQQQNHSAFRGMLDSKRHSQYSNHNRKPLHPDELNSNNKWSDYSGSLQKDHKDIQKQKQIQVQDTENDDDQFQMLAKKWLQLKQKNLQQMTQGLSLNNQEQQLMNSRNLAVNSKISKTYNIQSRTKQSIHKKGSVHETVQIDELDLNRALKSRDFSASRLLNSKSKRNFQQSNYKKSVQNSQNPSNNNANSQIYKDTQIHSNYQIYGNSHVNGNSHVDKNSYKNRNQNRIQLQQNSIHGAKNNFQKGSKGIDFYSADLLDLVEEINQ